MAVTPNNIVTPQSIGTIVGQIATGDQTTASDFGTATTNGRLLYNVLIYPAASDREVTLYIHNGTAASKVCMVDITADAAAPIVPIDILANVPLPVDANGNQVLYIAAGHKLQLSAESVAVTNDAIANCQEL